MQAEGLAKVHNAVTGSQAPLLQPAALGWQAQACVTAVIADQQRATRGEARQLRWVVVQHWCWLESQEGLSSLEL